MFKELALVLPLLLTWKRIGIDIAIDIVLKKIDIAIAIDIDKGKKWYYCLWDIDIAIDIDIKTWQKMTLIALLPKVLILPLPLKIFEATIDIAIDRKILLLLMSGWWPVF